jgi:uncharacterized membrane protein YgdD (TMEM256/DUF423 family)
MTAAALLFRIGCLLAFLAVSFGAFGAHALGATLQASNMTSVYETGVQYAFYHSAPTIGIGALLSLPGCPHQRALCIAGILFVCGTVLFSGSLFALALSGIDAIGIITPFGGLAFLIGWVILMVRGPAALARHGAESSNARLLPVR